jgi:hypothetical protein
LTISCPVGGQRLYGFEAILSFGLELPIAREYEAQLKAAKEKKARESVPQF